MITLIFEAHSTTYDNEAELSSGHNDVDLSPLGLEQAADMGQRYHDKQIDAVYCSDLQRSYKTAAIAFEGRFIPIYTDKRLRECDYGDLTQAPADQVKAQRAERVSTPFPNGESYEQTCTRMQAFLDDVAHIHESGDTIMVIGHRATQYGIEHAINGDDIMHIVTAPWKWQPGWTYNLEKKS